MVEGEAVAIEAGDAAEDAGVAAVAEGDVVAAEAEVDITGAITAGIILATGTIVLIE